MGCSMQGIISNILQRMKSASHSTISASLTFCCLTCESTFLPHYVAYQKSSLHRSNSTRPSKSAVYWSATAMSGNPITLYGVVKGLSLLSSMEISRCQNYTLITLCSWEQPAATILRRWEEGGFPIRTQIFAEFVLVVSAFDKFH